ncbi:hypothetical protein BJ684DRAFT_18355 [Piptocephalis cylindrospora]|uniref:Uncharacterized protein n=1 Tax=Piptocephalis cylindrospora TaxID=1907219 RepID=A0A4P9Y944_9FUNG|nr:hypothetical protein BJ684DRAFT_18355 [Piptocephalis cylindrospora]|eukprot:RKP15312.1 hypothetical protein BJ684DRAFT_18355 [Piptocephalis cylindrospora]
MTTNETKEKQVQDGTGSTPSSNEGQMEQVADVLQKSLEGVNSSFSKVYGVLASSMQQSVALAQNVGSVMEQLLCMNLKIESEVLPRLDGERSCATPSLCLVLRVHNSGTIPIPGISGHIAFQTPLVSSSSSTEEEDEVKVEVESVGWSDSSDSSRPPVPISLWTSGDPASDPPSTVLMPPHTTLERTGKALKVEKKSGFYLLDQAHRRSLSSEEAASIQSGWGEGSSGLTQVSLEALRQLFSLSPIRGMSQGDCMLCQWNGVTKDGEMGQVVLILDTLHPSGQTGDLLIQIQNLPEPFAHSVLGELKIIVGATSVMSG